MIYVPTLGGMQCHVQWVYWGWLWVRFPACVNQKTGKLVDPSCEDSEKCPWDPLRAGVGKGNKVEGKTNDGGTMCKRCALYIIGTLGLRVLFD